MTIEKLRVAVKMISSKLVNESKESQVYFKRELENLESLRDVNIVKFIKFYKNEHHHILVFEKCKEDLRKLL